MDKRTAHTIMQFMLRVNLSGHEVPAFNESMNALQAEVDRQESATQEMKDGTNE